MVDLRLGNLRLVGGARAERWALKVTDAAGTRTRDPLDVLASANLTWSITPAINIRAAGYQTLARPDPRELTESSYQSVSGECQELGTPSLTHSRILNADLRLEWYPSAGELMSVSGFYKRFDDPIVQLVGIVSGCEFRPFNADFADNVGIEVEARKGLGALSGALDDWMAFLNFTWVTGAARTKRGEDFDVPGELPLQDQSEFLVNASLSYTNTEAGFDFTILYNVFTERLRRYGALTSGGGGTGGVVGRAPDVYEEGRPSIDVKVRQNLT
jgi:outer membrane receptor protein involved in Fe transport